MHVPDPSRLGPRRRALVAGVGAWLVGLVVTYLLSRVAGGEIASFVGSAPVLFTSVAYATMHFWPVVLQPDLALLYLGLVPIPGCILAGGGYALAALQRERTTRGGARSGAAIALGYLIMALLTAGYVVLRGRGGFVSPVVIDVGPAVLGLIVLVGGVLFPLCFGGLGGVLYARRQGSTGE